MRHLLRCGLDLLQQTQRLNVVDDPFARFETIERAIGFGRRVVDFAVSIEHVDLCQPLPLADLEVVEVVCRCDLDRTRPLFGIGVFVRHDRNLAAHER